MAAPKKRPERTRHPTMWCVQVLRWEFREHASEHERLLSKEEERGPGVQLGQQIGAIAVTDRAFAIAVAQHFLERYADEAAGRMSLEIHVHPPERDVEDEGAYRVSDEVVERGRKLGIEDDVEQQIKRMARDGTPYTHPRANLRHARYALRIEGNDVVWIGLADPARGPRKTKQPFRPGTTKPRSGKVRRSGARSMLVQGVARPACLGHHAPALVAPRGPATPYHRSNGGPGSLQSIAAGERT